MICLEFDSSLVSRCHPLTNELSNSQKIICYHAELARLQKRDFARQIGLFEKPNGHVPRGCITYKLFFSEAHSMPFHRP